MPEHTAAFFLEHSFSAWRKAEAITENTGRQTETDKKNTERQAEVVIENTGWKAEHMKRMQS